MSDATANGARDGTSDDAMPGMGADSSVPGTGDSTPPCTPSDEVCDDQDNDCDGRVDESLSMECTVGVGACQQSGQQTCVDGRTLCDAAPLDPSEDTCDGQDNDCDGMTDEGTVTCGRGACQVTVPVCENGAAGPECTPGPPTESFECDRVDNDCDGTIDEEIPCNGCLPGTYIPAGWSCVPDRNYWIGTNQPNAGFYTVEYQEYPLRRPFIISQHEITREIWTSQGPMKGLAELGDDCLAGCEGGQCPLQCRHLYEYLDLANVLSEDETLTPCYTFHYRQGDEIVDDTRWTGPEPCPLHETVGLPGQCGWYTRTPDCDGYRLPTSAEWEIAARGGYDGTGCYWFGDEIPEDRDGLTLSTNNSDGRVHPVGTTVPNGFGLYDIHGNVAEWTQHVLLEVVTDRGGSAITSTDDALCLQYRHVSYGEARHAQIGVRFVRSALVDNALVGRSACPFPTNVMGWTQIVMAERTSRAKASTRASHAPSAWIPDSALAQLARSFLYPAGG